MQNEIRFSQLDDISCRLFTNVFQVSCMLTHSFHCRCKRNKNEFELVLFLDVKTHPKQSQLLPVSACCLQTVPHSQKPGKTSQRHVANFGKHLESCKTFTFTTTRSNLQLMAKFDQNFQNVPLESNMFADTSSVP